MKKYNRKLGLMLSFFLFISTILSVLVIPLPIAKAAPAYSWSTFTVAASGDDVETLSKTGFSNYTTDGDNLWVHSNEYTTRAWLRFEGLGAITNAGGIIDQIILSMYSGADEGADYEEVPGGYVTVAAPMYAWDWELTEENIAAADMNPIASFDGDYLSPSGSWFNWTISTGDPRDWYAWSSNFNDVFICYVGGFMQYSPDWTYYRSFTSFDEGHPAKLYVKYHTGEGYEEVLDYFGVDSATYNQSWNNYNIWGINGTTLDLTGWNYQRIIDIYGSTAGNQTDYQVEVELMDIFSALPTNNATFQTTPTHDATNQSVHPSIIYFPDGWNGYKYWLAMCPYPGGNPATEKVNILASNNGESWEVPSGLTNPIEDSAQISADPDLFYNEATDEIWCYYTITRNGGLDGGVYRRTSSDGINWSARLEILTDMPFDFVLTPSVVKVDSTYYMWTVEKTGEGILTLYLRNSTDGSSWESRQTCTINGTFPYGEGPWHLDINYIDEYNEFWMLLTIDNNPEYPLSFTRSRNRIDWYLYPRPLLEKSSAGWDVKGVYKSTFIMNASTMRIWYAGRNGANVWHIGYTTATMNLTDVDIFSKTKMDGGDVRITDSDGETELDYWLYFTGGYSSIWVSVPTIPADPNNTSIYFYYGNPSASTTSNFSNVFPIFTAGHETGDLTEWDGTNGNPIATTDAPYTGSYGAKLPGAEAPNYPIINKNLTGDTSGYAYCIYFMDQKITTADHLAMLRVTDSIKYIGVGIHTTTSSVNYSYHDIDWAYSATSIPRSAGWHLLESRTITTNNLTIDGTLVANIAGLNETGMTVMIGAGYKAGTGYFDDAFIRKYVYPEPSPGILGDEVSGLIEGYVATAPNGTVITPDPYETPEEVLEFIQDWDEDYGPVLAISIANIDAVEWVFEGKKRYEFTVEYINVNLTDIQQVGVGFTDETNHFHSVWYDRDANTLTVTSPEDGISGWLHSLTEVGEYHTGINVTAVFHIMFNVPIPDSYSVSAYAKIIDTADSGWIDGSDWDGGFIFNIYNLGGLSTLTDSGMAGRVTGGDIFEIYAADTRTPILIPLEDFDVRQNPIAWWESGITEEVLIDEIDWMIWMPRRDDGLTMYPTNQLPSGAAQSKNAYHSYPFGLRIIDNQTDANRYMYMEKNFWREIDASDDELVFTQFHMMSPDVGEYGDPGAGGEIRVMDRSIKQEGFAYLALRLRFSSTGYLIAYNDTATGWVNVTAVTNYEWYNVTSVFNLTTQTVDVYVEDVLKLDDLPFDDEECTSLKTLWVGRANAGIIRNDFYVDDIGAWTDWDADYGGLSKATMLFKNLQHWGMDMDFFIEDGQVHAQGASGSSVGRMTTAEDYSDHGYWEFGWDIMLNETWVNDFLVARVNVSDGNIGVRNNWVAYNVTWYSQGEYVKEDLLYGLFEGYSIFPGGDKDTSGWHWDIWFNRANASTIVGARINTEYFGMSDKSVWWAVWSSLWKPMRTEVSESTIFVDLDDAEGNTHSAKDVLFVRSWVEVLRTLEAEFAYKIVNIAGLDFLIARDTMSGIDTPPVRETKVPDVVSGFFGSALGSIFSAALKRLGNTLAGFGMGFFTMSIAFIDNVFAALGYPALVSTIFGWMDSLFSSVPILLGHGLTLIEQIFRLITVSASDTLTQLTRIITIWVGMYNTTQQLFTGVLTPGINLWNDLGVNSFIQIGAVLYPLWLLMMGMDKGFQSVIDHVNGVLNIGGFFLNFILNVGGFFMSLLTGLIGAIRG